MKSVTRLLILLAFFAVFVAWANVYSIPEAAAGHCSRGESTLSGPTINGRLPSGKAKWQGNDFCQPLELQVEVNEVNLPDGTILDVDACAQADSSNIVGRISLRGGSGKLTLSKLDSDVSNDGVPFCDMRSGERIKLLRDSTIILSGCLADSTGKIPGAPEEC
jgi:hypothetical protein